MNAYAGVAESGGMDARLVSRGLSFLALAVFVLLAAGSARGESGLPEGTIAFTSWRSGCGGPDIYTMSSDGSDLRRVTQTCFARDPAWSPDGTQLAFVDTRDGHDSIAIMKADGGEAREVTPPSVWGKDPAWSKQGVIAFTDASNGGILMINADGGGLRRITNQGGSPAWSPDGTKIAYGDRGVGATVPITVVNADGNDPRVIGAGDHPAFSPDGSRLAWSARDYTNGGNLLQIANVDGSGQHTLLATFGAYPDGLEPAWATDSTWLTYDANTGDDIFAVSALGGTPTRLTVNAAVDVDSAWRPTTPSTGLVIRKISFRQRACATRPGRATIVVTDAQNRSLSGATVTATTGQGTTRGTTDQNGTATITIRTPRRHHGRLKVTIVASLAGRTQVTRHVSLPTCR